MRDMRAVSAVVAFLVVGQAASGIDCKKNTISGGGMTNKSTFSSFSSSVTVNGSNTTTVTSGEPMFTSGFGDFDWGDHGFGRKTLSQSGSDHDNGLICSALQSYEACWKRLACDFRGRFSAVRVDRVW